jgi:hypothetical protein
MDLENGRCGGEMVIEFGGVWVCGFEKGRWRRGGDIQEESGGCGSGGTGRQPQCGSSDDVGPDHLISFLEKIEGGWWLVGGWLVVGL